MLGMAVVFAAYIRGVSAAGALVGRSGRAGTRAAVVHRLIHEIGDVRAQIEFPLEQKRAPFLLSILSELTRVLPDGTWLTEFEFDGARFTSRASPNRRPMWWATSTVRRCSPMLSSWRRCRARKTETNASISLSTSRRPAHHRHDRSRFSARPQRRFLALGAVFCLFVLVVALPVAALFAPRPKTAHEALAQLAAYRAQEAQRPGAHGAACGASTRREIGPRAADRLKRCSRPGAVAERHERADRQQPAARF